MTTSGHLVQVARQALYPNLPVPNKVVTMAVKQVRQIPNCFFIHRKFAISTIYTKIARRQFSVQLKALQLGSLIAN